MTNNIFILTGDVQIGKSAFLLKWIKGKSCGGFITPTKRNKKVLYDIATGDMYPYELSKPNEMSIAIGKYHLDESTFLLAQEFYKAAQEEHPTWFVMDEIGKLELNGEGHSQLLQQVLNTWDGKLLLVIRQSLVDEVIEKFGIKTPNIIPC